MPEIACRPACSASELAAHFSVRHQVFVAEQRLFTSDDRDGHDIAPGVIHILGLVDGAICGTVRLYPASPDGALWQGDRLAVLPDQRHLGLGAPLVRFAVLSAGHCGGARMLAHVQLDNVAFFEKLGWHPVGEPETYVGTVHQEMAVDLATGAAGASPAQAAGGSSRTRG